jgi:predicted Zn-dependent peptidase
MRLATMRPTVMLTLLAVFLVTGVQAFDFTKLQSSVTEHRLTNGLTVLVMERHEAPVVSFATMVNAGSVDDPKGYTGLAHMFEHMAFKGTTTLGTKDWPKEKELIKVEDSIFMLLRDERNRGRFVDSVKVAALTKAYEEAREKSYAEVVPNAFGQLIEREGGKGLNAGTGEDYTVYFYSLPSNKVELWMATESERFLNPVFREMYKERDVVAEERRMRVESSPIGRMVEEFLTASFKAHPYGVSGIGNMSDIQYYSRAEAEAFFTKYYSPANVVVVIVGDVKTADVIAQVEKYFGRIAYRPAPPRIATVEPLQQCERRSYLEDPSQPIYLVGWHVPEGTHLDRPALDALADYLGSGRTSVLYKTLVKEKKLAVQAQALTGFPGEKYPGLFGIIVVPSAGHTNDECEKDVFSAVERLQSELLTVDEVKKIQARARARFINQLNANSGLSLQLAGYQTLWGDWREMFHELDRINAVTPEAIQRVAKQYLTKKNRTVVLMNTSAS